MMLGNPIVVLCLVVLIGCHGTRTASEHHVHTFVLTDTVLKLYPDAPFESLVIFDQTRISSMTTLKGEHPGVRSGLVSELPSADVELIDSFLELNQSSASIGKEFRLDLPVHLLRAEQWRNILESRSNPYPALRNEFPNPLGPIWLSRVALGKDGRHALVQYDLWNDHAAVLLLEREGNLWQVRSSVLTDLY